MKTKKILLALTIFGFSAISFCGCKHGTPADAVRSAMEKEIIKEKAEDLIEEENVPAVVVNQFLKTREDTIQRQWLVYKKPAGERVIVVLPEVYIVSYSNKEQEFRAKYSSEGEIIDINHLTNLSVLPDPALHVLQRGEYSDWEVIGDVYETLDNITNEPVAYIVMVKKGEQKERIFFNTEGKILKIQSFTQ